jgi:hypothetical protein
MGCGLMTFENFYTVFFTDECKCCAPTLESHAFYCQKGTLNIKFQHYRFCEPFPVADVKVKLGIKSNNLTVWESYNSTDIGTWDITHLKSYERAPVNWRMHKWFYEHVKSEKHPVIMKFGPSYTYWSETPWMNLSKICG